MSIRVRMMVAVSAILVAGGAYAQQSGAKKRPPRSMPPVSAPTAPPTEAAVKELMSAGRATEAARLLEEHSRRAPGDKRARARAAEVYESQGDLTAAKHAAREALAGDAPSPEAFAVLGRIAAREGDWAAAVNHWRNVVNAKPNDAAAHLDYANALEHVGDAAGANNEYAIYRSLVGMAPIQKDDTTK
jgi:Flp pilus assembly protein TadD